MAGQNIGHSTVTKADIVEKVYEKIGFSKKKKLANWLKWFLIH